MRNKAWLALAALVLVGSLAGCPLGRGSNKFGDKCTADNDCADARCAPDAKVCTKSCANDTECGGTLVCRVTGTSGYCDSKKP